MTTVISGTLKTEDLLAAFFQELKERASDRAVKYEKTEPDRVLIDLAINAPSQLATILYYDGQLAELCQMMIDDLMNDLNAIAPEGFYFGAHYGDGADFGWWPIEDEEWEKEEE